MTSKKVTYNPKTRKYFSNPFNKYSHKELLRLANVNTFDGNFEIERLHDGRIKVKATVKSNSTKKK